MYRRRSSPGAWAPSLAAEKAGGSSDARRAEPRNDRTWIRAADRASHSGGRSDSAFQAEHADVLGRLVKLGPTVDTILSRHDYPEPVSQLLGEAVALTALLGASLKYEGKFILQASTDGPVDLLVADYQVPGGQRGCP